MARVTFTPDVESHLAVGPRQAAQVGLGSTIRIMTASRPDGLTEGRSRTIGVQLAGVAADP